MTSRAGNGEGPKPERRAETENGRMFFFVQIDALLLPSPRAGLRDDFLLFVFSSVGDTYLSAEFQSAAAAAAAACCSILVSNEQHTKPRLSMCVW
jgi:hypothetical protein